MLAGSGREGLLHAAAAYGARLDDVAGEGDARLDALDAARHAEGLAGRPVLLVRAPFDGVIPREAFDSLSAALGDPRTHIYPTGHETFSYVLPLAVERALDRVDRSCAALTAQS
jgi:hypothetical protein